MVSSSASVLSTLPDWKFHHDGQSLTESQVSLRDIQDSGKTVLLGDRVGDSSGPGIGIIAFSAFASLARVQLFNRCFLALDRCPNVVLVGENVLVRQRQVLKHWAEAGWPLRILTLPLAHQAEARWRLYSGCCA